MKHKKFKKIVFVLLTTAFFFSVLSGWFVWESFINLPGSATSQEVIYEIQPGLSFKAVAKDLEKNGIISSSRFFIILGEIRGGVGHMKVGEYLLNKNMRPTDVFSIIVSGKSIEHKLTISEGLNIFEIAQLFEEAGLAKHEKFMALVQNKELIKTLLNNNYSSLEGYLFPETYKFTKYTDPKTVIVEMVKKFLAVYKEVEASSKLNGWSRHQIVTLASIIEKETSAPEERPLISSVFHNRLQKGMRLQTDPTILYGKAMELGHFVMKISKADIGHRTAYNTYVIRGLPPGPIANPGKEALFAALNPAQSEYLYFVSRNDGTHVFSEDYKHHQKAVAKYQLDSKAREGKSWRDLKKRKTN